MIQEAKCKFCGCTIHLLIDDEYAAVGRDVFGLLKKAACNRCGDYMLARSKLKDQIKFFCESLAQRTVSKEDMPHVRESLTILLKRWMRLYAERHDLDLADWDEMLLEGILHSPGDFEKGLGRVPAMFQQKALI